MVKQTKGKKSENFGKGKVTPVQVAFIVDCYLSDNGYAQTRSAFRTEAPGLISRSPVQEAPKSLLSLGAMLDEYICLKEQKVLVDQERVRLEQERNRVQALLQGMQGVMDAYNSAGGTNALPLPAATMVAAAPQLDRYSGSSTGCRVYTTPNTMPMSVPSNINTEPASFYTPTLNQISTNKRKNTKCQEKQPPAKRSRKKAPPTGNNNVADIQMQKDDPQCSLVKSSSSPVQGSSVAKCLFNKSSQSPPSNSQSPKTPPRKVSCQSDKSSNKSNCQQETTPTNQCTTVISSERLTVSPDKHITYTVERSRCVMTSPGKPNPKRASSKRDHVKGRLDFDGSNELAHSADEQIVEMGSASEDCQDLELFCTGLPNFDLFGTEFSELLVDFDLGGEGIDVSCEPAFSTDDASGSSHESGDGNLGNDQVMSEFTSSVKVVSDDNHLRGPETTTTMKAITKCIRIVSPGKSQ